jgi:hypothetical protein
VELKAAAALTGGVKTDVIGKFGIMAATKLQGIFTPNLVPYTADGGINEGELRRYADWLIARGVHGLYPNGSTGEFTRFTPEERRRIVAILAGSGARSRADSGGCSRSEREGDDQGLRVLRFTGNSSCRDCCSIYYKLSPASVYAYFARSAGILRSTSPVQHSDVCESDRCADDSATVGRSLSELWRSRILRVIFRT